jgi:hypothetical protein
VLGSGQLAGRDWDYVVFVNNGDQKVTAPTAEFPNPFEKDDNTAKCIVARVRFHPVKALTTGASVYRDRLQEFDAKGVNTGLSTRLLSYGGQATWEAQRGGVELEYTGGYTETSAGIRVSRYGLSAMAWGNLGRVRPYLRYEGHDPDRAIPDNQAAVLLGGLNVRIEHGLFLKAELDRNTAGIANTRFKGQDYTETKLSVSYGF